MNFNLNIERNKVFDSFTTLDVDEKTHFVEFVFRKSYSSPLKDKFHEISGQAVCAYIEYEVVENKLRFGSKRLSINRCEIEIGNKVYDKFKNDYEKWLIRGMGKWIVCSLVDFLLQNKEIDIDSQVFILASTLDHRDVPTNWQYEDQKALVDKFRVKDNLLNYNDLSYWFPRCFSQLKLIKYYESFGFVPQGKISCHGVEMISNVKNILRHCALEDF